MIKMNQNKQTYCFQEDHCISWGTYIKSFLFKSQIFWKHHRFKTHSLKSFFFQKSKIRTWSFIEHTELHIQFSFPEIIQGIFISMLCLVRMSLCLTGRKLSETDEFQWLWEMNLIKIFQNINQYNGQLHNIIFYNLFYGFFLLEVSRSKIQETHIQYTCILFINEYKFV